MVIYVNLLLLTSDEQFIKYLDTSNMEIKEVCESEAYSTLTISYPLSSVSMDLQDFRQGNKLYLNGSNQFKDCLYVINEQVTNDLWDKNLISFTVEEVLVELNYAQVITQADIPTDEDLEVNQIEITSSVLTDWFGEYYHIGTVETGLLTNIITVEGVLTRMELLRLIEETTGNIFTTSYTNTGNVITRTLNLKRPRNAGTTQNTVIDLGYNADNITYTVDESSSYRAISPNITKDNNTTDDDYNNLINNFIDLEVTKGTQVPWEFSSEVTSGVFPARVEGQCNINYWRRLPGDSSYSFYPGLVNYVSTVSTGTSSMALEDWTNTHAGALLTCTQDGTYSYWNGSSVSQITTCKTGDQWICNGTTWKLFRLDDSGSNKPKYVTCTATREAPYTKHKGHYYVSDIDHDTQLTYNDIYSRADYTNELSDVTEEPTTTETAETGDTPTVETTTNTQHNTPKTGTTSTQITTEYGLYNTCSDTLTNTKYPELNIETTLNNKNYNINDNVQVKVPDLPELVTCTVTKTEKNYEENKITLTNKNLNGSTVLSTPHFELTDMLQKPNSSFVYTGYLYEMVAGTEEEEGATVETLTETPLANKWISIAVIQPESKKTTYTTTIKSSTSSNGTKYWSKYGVSPDKTRVCGIGYTSTGADTHAWGTNYKGIFKNYCPNCKRTGTLRWNRGSRAKSAAQQDGEFTCSKCDSDYSVEGNEKGSTHRKMTRYSLTKSNSTDSSKLLKGKLVYSNNTTSTTSTAKSTSTTTETVAGKTYLYSAKTDSTGMFKVTLKLTGLEKEDYTVQCTFGGDGTYDSCTDTSILTVPTTATYKTVYSTSTNGSNKSTVTTSRIPRSTSRTNCTNLKRQSGVVSNTVIKKAKSIAGTKTGLTAAKLLAKWVAENITHVNKKNFYQSPAKTLSSRRGNCCCKTDLFLQMCEALNLSTLQNGDLVLKYVHYHTSSKGHVYALIRHKDKSKGTYVDVSHKDCWGNICSGYYNTNYMKTSTYPCLPFERSY